MDAGGLIARITRRSPSSSACSHAQGRSHGGHPRHGRPQPRSRIVPGCDRIGHLGGRRRCVRRAARLARRVAPDARDGQLGQRLPSARELILRIRALAAVPTTAAPMETVSASAPVAPPAEFIEAEVVMPEAIRTGRSRTRHGSRARSKKSCSRRHRSRCCRPRSISRRPAEPTPSVESGQPAELPAAAAAAPVAPARSWCRPAHRCLPRTRSLRRHARRCCRGANPLRRRSAANWRVSTRTCSMTC